MNINKLIQLSYKKHKIFLVSMISTNIILISYLLISNANIYNFIYTLILEGLVLAFFITCKVVHKNLIIKRHIIKLIFFTFGLLINLGIIYALTISFFPAINLVKEVAGQTPLNDSQFLNFVLLIIFLKHTIFFIIEYVLGKEYISREYINGINSYSDEMGTFVIPMIIFFIVGIPLSVIMHPVLGLILLLVLKGILELRYYITGKI